MRKSLKNRLVARLKCAFEEIYLLPPTNSLMWICICDIWDLWRSDLLIELIDLYKKIIEKLRTWKLYSPKPFSASHLSASRAAAQPVPAAVMAWRYFWSCTSPAAKIPSILVSWDPDLILI